MQRYVVRVSQDSYVAFDRHGLTFVPLEDAALMIKDRAEETVETLVERYKLKNGPDAVAPIAVYQASIQVGAFADDIYRPEPTRRNAMRIL